MKVSLERYTPAPDEICGEAAAVCYQAKNPEKSLQHTMKSGHESVLEHAVFTFRIEGVSRVLLAQLTRHRIASFSVASQRYIQQNTTPIFIPPTIQGKMRERAVALADSAQKLYSQMLDEGIKPEDARYILPQGITTTLYLTMNARELRHFFKLRCCHRAQKEIQVLADLMLRLCKRNAPLLFAKAGPGCVCDRCKEEKPCGHPRQEGEWDE